MAVNIGPKIGIDGEAQFRKSINDIIQQSKTLDSEMKAVTAAFDANDNSQEKLSEQSRILSRQVELQQQRIDELKKGVSAATSEFGAADSRTLKWQQALYGATEQMRKTQSKLNNLGVGVEDISDALDDASDQAESFGDAMMDGLASGTLVSATIDLVSAIKDMSDETAEYRRIMASLQTSSEKAGYTAQQTADKYKQLHGVLGEDQAAATTLANLQAINLEQSKLTKIIDGTIGAWSVYGDSIPIDGLGEALNETIKVGQVTGTFADVLNWAGISEDDFNAALAATNSTTERANLVLEQLANQGLIDAGRAWQENNQSLIKANENTARWQEITAKVAERVEPLLADVNAHFLDIVETTLDLTEGLNIDFGPLESGLLRVGAAAGAYIGITKAIQAAKKAQEAFNAATKANPIGLAASAITLTVFGLIDLTKALDESALHLSEAQEQWIAQHDISIALAEASEDAAGSYKELSKQWSNQTSKIDSLVNRYAELIHKTDLTVAEELELKSVISGLNSAVPGLSIAYDSLTKSTNMTADAVTRYANEAKRELQYNEAIEQRNAAQEQLNQALERRAEIQQRLAELQKQIDTTGVGDREELLILNTELEDITKAVDNFQIVVDGYNGTLSTLSGEMTEEYVDASAQRVDAIRKEAEESQELYTDIYETATNMFEKLETESEISVDEMIENLRENQQAVSDWADNLGILAERGIDQGLLRKMQEMGPEAAGYVAEMVGATDEQLAEMSALWAAAADTAGQALVDSIAAKTPEVGEAAQGVVDGSVPDTSEFIGTGYNIAQGMINGMDEYLDRVAGTSAKLARAARAAAERELDINSPSGVFEGIGIYSGQGYEIGFVESMRDAEKEIVRSVDRSVYAAENAVPDAFDFPQPKINTAPRVAWSDSLYSFGLQHMAPAAGESKTYTGDIQIVVQAAPDTDVQALAEAIELRLQDATDRREAVW